VFRGLSKEPKRRAALRAAGFGSSALLRDLAGHGGLLVEKVDRLLDALCDSRKAVKPRRLGVIGHRHLEARLAADFRVERSSVRATRRPIVGVTENGLPYLVEAASGIMKDRTDSRRILLAVNWSPFVETDDAPLPAWLTYALGESAADAADPVVIALSAVCPRAEPTDPGKVNFLLPAEVRDAAAQAVARVIDDWRKEKAKIRREERMSERAMDRYARIAQPKERTCKDVFWRFIPEIYPVVADQERVNQANARQLYYGFRPLCQAEIGWCCSDQHVTQTLLPDYMADPANQSTVATWNVCWDDHGYAIKPHTRLEFGLGTAAVAAEVMSWDGELAPLDIVSLFGGAALYPHPDPRYHYRAALLIEKVGFLPHFGAAEFAERHDVLLVSPSGMPPVACRQLINALSKRSIRTGVLHDCDPAGLVAAYTLRTSNRRFTYDVEPLVVGLGLRLAQVPKAPREEFSWPSRQRKDPRSTLLAAGGTKREVAMLVQTARPPWKGERIELNHMTTDKFIAFADRVVRRLTGGERLVPDEATLQEAYRRARSLDAALRAGKRAYDATYAKVDRARIRGLERRVQRQIRGTALSWQDGIRQIAAKDEEP
jgi:hypothetical protein